MEFSVESIDAEVPKPQKKVSSWLNDESSEDEAPAIAGDDNSSEDSVSS
jgi:hypothetical protein